jgi:uncharacterized protein
MPRGRARSRRRRDRCASSSTIAARNREVAFIVPLAGMGVPGDQILLAQSEMIARASGVNPDLVAKNDARLRDLLALLKSPTDRATLETQIRARLSDLPAQQVESQDCWR